MTKLKHLVRAGSRALVVVTACCTVSLLAAAQPADTLRVVLPEVSVQATRGATRLSDAPFALATLGRSEARVALAPGLSLDDVLGELPGVWIADRGHYALGERLMVRGMGWRSAFGVRGVQVLLDGIPLTMADGQTALDVADPSLIRSAELLRGPASLFWGNAAGGALLLTSFPAADAPRLRGRALGGSYGLRQLGGELAVGAPTRRLHLFATDVRQDGFRDHAYGRFTRAGAQALLAVGPASLLRLMATGAWQDAAHPGSLSREQVEQDRRMAAPGNLATEAGKKSLHGQLGATLSRASPVGNLEATVYGVGRTLDNALPYAFIDLDRAAGGLRLGLRREGARLGTSAGIDAAVQRDRRRSRDNDQGRPSGEASINQTETVQSAAAYALLNARLTPSLTATFGGRVDAFRFALDDRLPADGLDEGSRRFLAWSPSAGILYEFAGWTLFGNYSTAFETPTTTEFVNRADGASGFNPELDPQRTRGVELGMRLAPGGRLAFDAAVFRQWVRDGLVAFQTAAGGDRTFFRNASRSDHQGLEVSFGWFPLTSFHVLARGQMARFTFDAPGIGKMAIPGVPERRFYAEAGVAPGALWLDASVEWVGGYFVDDANLERNDAFSAVGLKAGYRGLRQGGFAVQPFVAVSNLLDVAYSNSVIINAFGGRHFEPSAGRTVQAGINFTFD